jgi:hypothetical protein
LKVKAGLNLGAGLHELRLANIDNKLPTTADYRYSITDWRKRGNQSKDIEIHSYSIGRG